MTEFERIKNMSEMNLALYLSKLQFKAVDDYRNSGVYPNGISVEMLKAECDSDSEDKIKDEKKTETFDIKKAIKRYNGIMNDLAYEHNTIGTKLSENTENWNIRDMVAECDYVLSTYYEDGHVNNDMRYSDELSERKMWKNETNRLKRFINDYKQYIDNIECISGHASNYD